MVASIRRDLPPSRFAAPRDAVAAAEAQPVFRNGGWIETPILRRETLGEGVCGTGPFIIQELGATSVVPPGWQVTVDASGKLLCKFVD